MADGIYPDPQFLASRSSEARKLQSSIAHKLMYYPYPTYCFLAEVQVSGKLHLSIYNRVQIGYIRGNQSP